MVALNMPNCSKKERSPHSDCTPTSPENPTFPLSLGTCCPVWGLSTPMLSLEFLSNKRRRQTPTHAMGWFWDCLRRQGCAHAIRKPCGETPRFGRGDRDKGEKCRKRAENVTPGCCGCNPPHNPALPQLKEKEKVVQGSWGLCHGDAVAFRGHVGGRQVLRGAPPGRHQLRQRSFPQMFWGPSMPGFGPLLLPRHECPQRRDPTTAPSSPLLSGITPRNGCSGKGPPEVILGLRSPALTQFAHLLLAKDEIIPFSCQRLKKI